jgi:hypothetical protein
MNVQLLFLGPVKQPEYSHGQDWYDEFEYNEKIKYYHISHNGDYRVGDGFRTTLEMQSAFGCSRNLEVYRIHSFLEEDDYCIDNDLVTLDDYIFDNCDGLYEI